MTANRRSVRKRRSKHKGSMKIITLIVLVLCGVFGVFTWQKSQKTSNQMYRKCCKPRDYTLPYNHSDCPSLSKFTFDGCNCSHARGIEQAEYQKTDAYIEDLAREKLGLVHEDEIIFKKK